MKGFQGRFNKEHPEINDKLSIKRTRSSPSLIIIITYYNVKYSVLFQHIRLHAVATFENGLLKIWPEAKLVGQEQVMRTQLNDIISHISTIVSYETS